MLSVAFTSISSVTGVTSIPAFSNTLRAVAPHGTSAWHSATFTSFFARSSTDSIPAGLSGGTAICIVFATKFVGSAASPPVTTSSMVLVLADANTSAGAP